MLLHYISWDSHKHIFIAGSDGSAVDISEGEIKNTAFASQADAQQKMTDAPSTFEQQSDVIEDAGVFQTGNNWN